MEEFINKKLNNLDDLRIDNALLTMYDIIKVWLKAKPEHKELNALKDSLTELGLLIAKKKVEEGNLRTALSNYRLRLAKAESEIPVE
ncbi:MAG: hypothetical protein CBE33_05220 [Candidatus Pelagibacter sp. TMED273]|nr:MAG: hypothetical protein CBE33_05220 [Candidatus Pelagibacter sp. TMED273]|tara:strand:- start:8200 stop:8460 length:261 start_codon:yes stop_codon:yes gene_type:complete